LDASTAKNHPEDGLQVRAPRTRHATRATKQRPTRLLSASPRPAEAADGTQETNRAPSAVSEGQRDRLLTAKQGWAKAVDNTLARNR